MLQKKITVLIFFLFPLFLASSNFKIYFIYKDKDYYIAPIEKKDNPIKAFNALKVIDQSQTHRVLLSSLEKSRLMSLFYVGDKYEFNDVEVMLKYNQKYQIRDKSTGFKVMFGIGKYDSIVLHSAVNFGDKKFDITDKLASTFAIKLLLKKMTGKFKKKDIVINDQTLPDVEINKEYEKFIEQLRRLKKAEIFKYLIKYINLNFQLEAETGITEDWVHPANLFFYKKGDYKSFAFFYYYTLKQLGFKVRSYLVSYIVKKEKEEINRMYQLFKKKYKNNNDLIKIQELELQYKYVNPSSHLKNFSYDYKHLKSTRPSIMFYYYPPDFKFSIFLVAVEINEKWIYTTGDKWVDAGIYKAERICAHYAKNGCYYAYIEKDFAILNNLSFSEKEILWDVFYDVK
ncbi:MAG: hypothetical protein KAT05_02900 [Spirochaetes bacterium]|nr:hypothetical protein [Spirochaetota bacterium]